MLFRYDYRGGVWIDLEKPTDEELREIEREFFINEPIMKEMASPTPLPLVIEEATYTFLGIHFPTQGVENGDTKIQEIDFVIGKNFIVTAHYEVIAPLHHLRRLFETQNLIAGHESITTDILLEILFMHLYSSVRDHTNHVINNLEHIEQDMFSGYERVTVRTISNISRSFLRLEAELANQEEPLSHFLEAITICNLFDVPFGERAKHILTERAQVARLIKTHRAVATEMRETNAALLEAHQNEIMKILTVVAFIFLPLNLITFVFGMGALGTPLKQEPNAFWIITGSMLALGMFITLFLARKRWIF